MPWKNGRGTTTELALWPPGSSFERGDFDWRLSRAAVDEPGPFSRFAGFERALVVTAGAGLQLEHGDDAPPTLLPRLQPYSFSGDWATTAALLDGPVADFNVLVRRGAFTAEVDVLRLAGQAGKEPLRAGHDFLHVLTGSAQARVAGADFALAAGESLWLVDTQQPQSIALVGRGELLLVRLESARAPARP